MEDKQPRKKLNLNLINRCHVEAPIINNKILIMEDNKNKNPIKPSNQGAIISRKNRKKFRMKMKSVDPHLPTTNP